MIRTKEEFDVVCKQFRRVRSALESLRREVEPKNKRNFDVLSEGYTEELERLSTQLRSFVGADSGPADSLSSGSPRKCPVCEGSRRTEFITENPHCSDEPGEQSHPCATCDGTGTIQ